MESTILEFLSLYGAIAILILMASNGLASAPPSELILGSSGVMASYGILTVNEAIIYAIIGNLLGALILYHIGTKIDTNNFNDYRMKLTKKHTIWSKIILRMLPSEKIFKSILMYFKENGGLWLFSFRFLPVVRSVISLPAGMAKYNLIKFTVYSALGMLVWINFWVFLGYYLGSSWAEKKLSITLTLALVACVAIYFLYKKIISNILSKA